jgi:menaquinone-specific isochorismate synthase
VTLAGDRARLCAGAGIVSGSDPDTEQAETTVKLTPVLQALWPGSAALLD